MSSRIHASAKPDSPVPTVRRPAPTNAPRRSDSREAAREAEADRTATRVLSTNGSATSTSGDDRGDVRSGGSSMPNTVRAFFEPRFGYDLSRVSIHADRGSATRAGAAGARAFTIGPEIRFGAGEYAPNSHSGRRLIAHELAHVVQQGHARRRPGSRDIGIRQSSPRQVQRKPLPGLIQAGDRLVIRVFGLPTDTQPEGIYSKTYEVDAEGEITIADGYKRFTVKLAGLSPESAAAVLAERLVSERIFRGPRVDIVNGGIRGTANAKSAPSPEVLRAMQRFESYISVVKEAGPAKVRYLEWVNEHRNTPEFLTTTPEQVWQLALQRPEVPKDPRAEKADAFLRLVRLLRAENGKRTDSARRAEGVEALSRFLAWYDSHKDRPEFLTADLAEVYSKISVGVLKESIDTKVRSDADAARVAAGDSPELQARRFAKFDEFFDVAKQLWGHSSRNYPYTIPIPSKGQDILVLGDPATQAVLDDLGRELMDWVAKNMHAPYFPTADPNAVLLDFLKAGYQKRLHTAQKAPLENERIDRNELLPSDVLLAFGETIATGVFVIAVAGAFVGAEILTLGQVTWILGGLMAGGGVLAYHERRKEIEQTSYDVSVPETMLAAAGDAVGASQIIEGVSGQRLGTNMPLGSEARSEQLGSGSGAAVTVLMGSRAFRAGESIGIKYRPPVPGRVPTGPNANADVALPTEVAPKTPTASASPGPIEAAARAKLTPEHQIGFDRWIGEMRGRGKDPEAALSKMGPARIQKIAESQSTKHAGEVSRGEAAARVRDRATDPPLAPRLANNENAGPGVTIHYETRAPSTLEVSHAGKIAARTGEPVRVFGDTVSKVDYPGIDGTIGTPPRPLSLKTHSSAANAESARFAAQQALIKAKNHGYSQVEVQILMPGKTVRQVKAGWDRGPTRPGDHPLEAYFEGNVIAKIVIECMDGVWRVPKGPSRTGVVPPGQPDRKENEP